VRETRDLRSFTKIVPALLAFPEAHLVTADDDMAYGGNWLERLLAGAPGDVACLRAHRVAVAEGAALPYDAWDRNLRAPKRGPLIFPTGVGGVLYPPGSLHEGHGPRGPVRGPLPRRPTTCGCGGCTGSPGARRPSSGARARLVEWPGSQGAPLREGNLAGGANDRAVAAMTARYGLPLS
jgi:hypothetical protein